MAETNNNTSEVSFLEEEKKAPKLHVKDILFIVLRNLHWLIICGTVGAFIAGYQVRHQSQVYQSSARVLIKGATASSTVNSNTIREASIRSMFNSRSLYNSDVNNEMEIMTSKTALIEIATTLKLNVRYTAKTKVVGRIKDLYAESPFTIDFIDAGDEDYVSIEAVALNDNQVSITLPGYTPRTVPFEDTVATPMGRIVIHKT